MMRPDHDTIHKVEALIEAAAARDDDRCGEIVVDLVECEQDAYLLMMTLATRAARLAHAMQHLLGAPIQADTNGEVPPTQTAVQIVVHIANDELSMARDLASTCTQSVAYAQHVLLALAFLAGEHHQHVTVVQVRDIHTEDRRN